MSNVILSHYQQGSNEAKYIVSNRIFNYTHVTWLYGNYLVRLIYWYDNIIHSSYEVGSLLPFLSEKHICILFLIKHTVLIECINMVFI